MCLFGVVAGASRFTERVRADGIAPRSRHYSQNSQRSQARLLRLTNLQPLGIQPQTALHVAHTIYSSLQGLSQENYTGHHTEPTRGTHICPSWRPP